MFQFTPINELTNKAVLGLATVAATGVLAVMGLGIRAYADSLYVPQYQFYTDKIAEYDRKIYEINEIFITVEQLDTITSRRLAMSKAYYENRRADLTKERDRLE